jgi:RNA recognition motif-containing protein
MYSTPAVGSIPATQQPASRGYRGDQNLNEANLHLSGYGPMTTPDEIIALFAPYVHVTEVVPKSNFSFVNTRDPDGARRAREALNGALLGGQPVRINLATRKAKNPMHETTATIPAPPPVPLNSIGQVDVDQVSKYLQLFYFVCIQFYPTNDALFMHDRFETTVAILQQRISSSQATDLPRRNNN